MWLVDFIKEYWPSILLALSTTGALALCRHFYKQVKEYKEYKKEQEKKETEALIDLHIEPLVKDVEDLRTYVINLDNEENRHINLIIASYRYRLMNLCKGYLTKKYLTPEQFDQLEAFYDVYTKLGGNGQAKEYFERVVAMYDTLDHEVKK